MYSCQTFLYEGHIDFSSKEDPITATASGYAEPTEW